MEAKQTTAMTSQSDGTSHDMVAQMTRLQQELDKLRERLQDTEGAGGQMDARFKDVMARRGTVTSSSNTVSLASSDLSPLGSHGHSDMTTDHDKDYPTDDHLSSSLGSATGPHALPYDMRRLVHGKGSGLGRSASTPPAARSPRSLRAKTKQGEREEMVRENERLRIETKQLKQQLQREAALRHSPSRAPQGPQPAKTGSSPLNSWVNVRDGEANEADTSTSARLARVEKELRDLTVKYQEAEKNSRFWEAHSKKLTDEIDSMTPNPETAYILGSEPQQDFSNEWRLRADQAEERGERIGRELEVEREQGNQLEQQLVDVRQQMTELLRQHKQVKKELKEKHRQPAEEPSTVLKEQLELLKEQARIYMEDFQREADEKEKLERRVADISSELQRVRTERRRENDSGIRAVQQERDQYKRNLEKLKQQMSNLKQMFEGISPNSGSPSQVYGSERPVPPYPGLSARGVRGHSAPSAPGPRRPAFELKWKCNACTFENTRQVSACEMCGTPNQLPIHIAGYEVTTPDELRRRQAAAQFGDTDLDPNVVRDRHISDTPDVDAPTTRLPVEEKVPDNAAIPQFRSCLQRDHTDHERCLSD